MRIVHYPHPTLRYVSKPVKRVDAALREAVQEMFALMYEAKGVGLAANQVGLPLRLFIVNLEATPGEGEELVFVNPVISRPKGTAEAEEGCLSLPGLYGNVVRPATVRINAYDLQGRELDTQLDGLLARVVQHETDHLDGVLFTDRMSATGKLAAESALEEFAAEYRAMCESGEVPDDPTIRRQRDEWEARYC